VFPEAITPRRLERIEAWLESIDPAEAPEADLVRRTATPIDLYHANSLELLERDVPGLGRRGDALVAIRSRNMIAVVAMDEALAVWRWGPGTLDRPHHASLLPDGTVSVFDNGWHRKASRVLRLAPDGHIVWQFPSQPGPDFFTQKRGSAQHLPNGNLLITESQRGRVFEIDAHGEIVWEFLNPEIDTETRRRARIYRMERLDAGRVSPLLAGGQEPLEPSRGPREATRRPAPRRRSRRPIGSRSSRRSCP
jgi:hypothetical protein